MKPENTPIVSIVIVSYNTEQMVLECLNSLLAYIRGYYAEIIVVDNNSSDGTVNMLRNYYPSILLIENNKNLGFAAANNQGLRVCRGRFILLLNSDTVILSDVVNKSIEYLANNQDVGAMGCRVLNSDGTVQATCFGYPTLFRLLCMTLAVDRISGLSILDKYLLRSWQRDGEREVEVITGCYLMIRREVLNQVGLLDESFFFFGEETDWCLRMRRAGWRLNFAPVGEIIHHGGGSIKKLNFQRDVMLTTATIRLHLKNSGIIAALLAFIILILFNISRAVFWTAVSLWQKQYMNKAEYFRNVTKAYRSFWPA